MKPRNRRGVALLAALSLMTLLGLLMIGAIASATSAERASRASLADGPLSAAADDAIARTLDAADSLALFDLPLGAPTIAVRDSSGGTRVNAVATRIGSILWIVAEARMNGDSSLRRVLGAAARFPMAGPVPRGAIVSPSSVTLAADVTVSVDSTGAADCAIAPSSATLTTADSAELFSGMGQTAALEGAPGVRHVRRDTTIATGVFEGILLVDGDLVVDGPFELRGLAIVGGSITASRGFHLRGAAIARGAHSRLSTARIEYSPCLVARSLQRAARPLLVRGRAVAELF